MQMSIRLAPSLILVKDRKNHLIQRIYLITPFWEYYTTGTDSGREFAMETSHIGPALLLAI